MVRLTDILDKVRGYHPKADTELINRAYVFAQRKHDGQTRKSGDPYFTHPVSVANIIADLRLDAASVCAEAGIAASRADSAKQAAVETMAT